MDEGEPEELILPGVLEFPIENMVEEEIENENEEERDDEQDAPSAFLEEETPKLGADEDTWGPPLEAEEEIVPALGSN